MSGKRAAAMFAGGAAPLLLSGIALTPLASHTAPDLSEIAAPLPGAPRTPIVKPAPPPGLAQCLARFAGGIGLPVHRSDDAASAQIVVCRDGYALSFNATTHNPDWVVERLNPQQLEHKFDRKDDFQPDSMLGASTPQLADYTGPEADPYQRGHQAPSEDFASNQKEGAESFYLSNMSPQIGGFNGGIWRVLEGQVRKWVTCTDHSDIVVITGPIYRDTKTRIGADQLWVPKAYYKIVYDVNQGQAVGFILDNMKASKPGGDFSQYVQPIAEIERETGLDFFSKLTTRGHTVIESRRGTPWGHIGSCTDPAH